MRVGIKYCGGCNPRYDRVAAVRELEKRHPEWQIEPAGDGGQEYILVVCGCTAVCAAHDSLRAVRHKFVINSSRSIYHLLKKVLELCYFR